MESNATTASRAMTTPQNDDDELIYSSSGRRFGVVSGASSHDIHRDDGDSADVFEPHAGFIAQPPPY